MKTVYVAEANGRTGLLIVKKLVEEGFQVIGLVRQESRKNDLENLGAKGVVGDLNGAFSEGLNGADAVICTAGAGINHRLDEVDHVGTVRLIEQSALQGVQRFIMVSSMRTHDPGSMPAIKPFLLAKSKAETVLEESGLTYTIIRPGELTDEEPCGRVSAAVHLEKSGCIPRADVASAAVMALGIPETENLSFDIISGDTPMEQALTRFEEDS